MSLVEQIAAGLSGAVLGILLGIPLIIAEKEQRQAVKEFEEEVCEIKNSNKSD